MYNFKLNQKTTMSIAIHKVGVTMVRCPDIPKVVDYMIDNYFPVEPLSKFTKLAESAEAVQCLRKICIDVLHQNVSMVATNNDGEIVGVSCNMIIRKQQKYDPPAHSVIGKIWDFVKYVADESDIYGNYPDVEEYMYIAFLSVCDDYREQSIAKRLIDSTRELALKLGLKIMRVDCCTMDTAKVAHKKGWTCLKEIEYENYKVDGEQVFHPDEQNTTFGVYIMNI